MAKEKIHSALIAVMKDIEAIGKDNTNQKQNYKFRGIDDLYNAVHPLLKKHLIYIRPRVISSIREQKPSKDGGLLNYSLIEVEYTFTTIDGSGVAVTMRGEAMDSGDKATNKAMSAALKYALMQMFLIPTQDLQDADAASHVVDYKKMIIETVKENVELQTNLEELTKYWDSLSATTQKIAEVSILFRDKKLALKKATKATTK